MLAIFSWGDFGDISDRYPGHPGSIDSLIKISEDLIVTGCSDGNIRVTQILPNSILGSLGRHGSLPVENLAISYDKKWIMSASHDCVVRFWDVENVFEDEAESSSKSDSEDSSSADEEDIESSENEQDEEEEEEKSEPVKKRLKVTSTETDFFADL